MNSVNNDIPLMYPDVLGAITQNRIHLDWLQYAVGIFPPEAYLNQHVDAVVILQSTIDQNMRVRVGVRPPKRDANGNSIIIKTAKPIVSLGLRPGEVGVLRIPMMPFAPISVVDRYPVQVAVRYRAAGESQQPVRPPDGGIVPAMLNISPVKLNALQYIQYEAFPWYQSNETVTTYFSVRDKSLPPLSGLLASTYETLWSATDMKAETRFVAHSNSEWRRCIDALADELLYTSFAATLEKTFAARELILYPAEVELVTKLMVCVIKQDVALLMQGTPIDHRWLQLFKQLVAHKPEVMEMKPAQILTEHLFEAVIYDAILTAFEEIRRSSNITVTLPKDQSSYADGILMGLSGRGTPNLTNVYMPLLIGGLLFNHCIVEAAPAPQETLSKFVNTLARRQRSNANHELYKIVQQALQIARQKANF